jgi:hypothetical protein
VIDTPPLPKETSMTRTTSLLSAASFVAAAFLMPDAQAQVASSATPEARAQAAAKEGPAVLRRFVHRTRMIYALNFNDFYPAKD